MGIITAAFLLVAAGCSDDPSNETAKNTQQQMAEALDAFVGRARIDEAKSQLQTILSQHSSGSGREAALLASANLDLLKARQQTMELGIQRIPAQYELMKIRQQVNRIAEIRLQRDGMQQLVAAGTQEIQELREVLDGGGYSKEGLRKGMEAARTQLQEYQDSKERIAGRIEAADEQIRILQQQADEKLAQARKSSLQQRTVLEKSGYDLLAQQKPYHFEKQSAMDDMKLFEDEIALVRPIVEQFEQDIQNTEFQIASMEQSEDRIRMRTLVEDLAAEEQKEHGALQDRIGQFQQTVSAYRDAADQILNLLEQARAQYEQTRSRQTGSFVQYKKGQSEALAASVYGRRLTFEAAVSISMESLKNSLEQDSPLRALLQEAVLTISEDALFSKMTALFDQADASFEQGLSGGFSLDVTKSRLLALHEKMRVADALDRFEAAEAAQTKLDELTQKTIEQNPEFADSETARLLEKGLDYIPEMPFDSELRFEQIRQQLTAWRNLRGPQRKAAGQQSLAFIQQLEAQADEKLRQLLEPEKQALLIAQEKNFEDETAPAPSSEGGFPAEPNGF